MTLDLNAFLVAVDASWQQDIALLEAQISADEAEIAAQEADVLLLEGAAPPVSDLDAPIPNPVTALVIGPTTDANTGWKDLGGTEHSFRLQGADLADTGSYSASADLYMFSNVGSDTPSYGTKFSNVGNNRYWILYYRDQATATWKQFSGGEATMDWGRQLLKEDVVDIIYANSTITFTLNGEVRKTFPVSVFQGKFPDGLGRFARYVKTSGTYAQKVTLSGGVIVPIKVRAIALGSGALPVFTFDYTGTPYGYVTRLTQTNGAAVTSWQPATLIENAIKGRATYQGPDKAPLKDVGYIYQLTEANIDGTPKSGVVPISATLLAPGPMQFATNITPIGDFYANSPMNNRVSYNWRIGPDKGPSLRRWDDADPQMGRDALPTAECIAAMIAANGVGPATFLKPPRKSGQLGRVRWKGNPSDVDFHNSIRNFTIIARGSNGTYSWIDYRHTFKLADLVYAGGYDPYYCWIAIKGGTPKELVCYDIDDAGNALSPTQWDKDYIADCKLFKGHSLDPIRCMDIQSVIGQSGRVVDVSDWALRGQYSPATGVSVLDLLDLFELVGVGGRLHIPLQATEGWVRLFGQTLKAFILRTGLYVSVAIANEIWNAFQPAWGIAQQLYDADTTTVWPGGAPASNNDKTLRYWSKTQATIMTWLTQELGEALPKCFRVIEAQNDTSYCANYVLTYWPTTDGVTDEIDVAPYIGGKAGANITGSDSAAVDALVTNLKSAYPPVHANALKVKTYALSKGKRFGTYEGGYENFENGALQRVFRNDPRGFAMTKEILDDWETSIGSTYRWYCDNGHPAYGQRNFAGQSYFDTVDGAPPAYVGQAFISKMAATQLIA